MFDFSMFLEFHFTLMSLATILLFVWFIVPYFYLTEHLTRHGYTEQDGSRLLSIIGIANCVGMVSTQIFKLKFWYVRNSSKLILLF